MDTTNNNRHIQDKPISVNKISASSRRSPSPSNETKINNKKVRPSGNTDVREWDLPKLQQEKDKSPIERHVIEEPIGNSECYSLSRLSIRSPKWPIFVTVLPILYQLTEKTAIYFLLAGGFRPGSLGSPWRGRGVNGGFRKRSTHPTACVDAT